MIKRYLFAITLLIIIPLSNISIVQANRRFISLQKNTNIQTSVIKKIPSSDNQNEFENLAFSIAENYVNIRTKPTLHSQIIGKLYKGAAATIILKSNGWVKAKSGNVTGYISKNYLAIGNDAKKLLNKYATKTATITTQTLKVRKQSTTQSSCLTLLPQGAVYTVIKDSNDWLKIKLDTSENKGYISKKYANISYKYKEAIPIRETEQAVQASTFMSQSSIGSTIAQYALQFVGNPYVWGGTSLNSGTDCSGFTQSIFKNFGYHIPRTSYTQATTGKSINISNLQPGDLIFYAHNNTVNHVALYIGNRKIIHASNVNDGIKVSTYNYRPIYIIKRFI